MTTDTLPAPSPSASPSPAHLTVTRSTFKNHQGSQAEEIVFSHASGFRIGGIVDGDRLLIDQVAVSDRGDGHLALGVATVSQAVRYADEHGLRFYFDCCTAGIRPVLSQMKRAGFVVRSNPGWSLSGSDEPAVEMRSAPSAALHDH